MRKLLIGVAAAVLAAGYVAAALPGVAMPSSVGIAAADPAPTCPGCVADPGYPGNGSSCPWLNAPDSVCPHKLSIGGGGGPMPSFGAQPPTLQPAPPPAPASTTAPVPAQNPIQQPFCTVTDKNRPLLDQCPNYTCANIIDDYVRTECNALSPADRVDVLNAIGKDIENGLSPPPLTPGGTPLDNGPCGDLSGTTHTACQVLLEAAQWAAMKVHKDEPPPNPDDLPVGCICIRG
jgi:hypothetical protein